MDSWFVTEISHHTSASNEKVNGRDSAFHIPRQRINLNRQSKLSINACTSFQWVGAAASLIRVYRMYLDESKNVFLQRLF